MIACAPRSTYDDQGTLLSHGGCVAKWLAANPEETKAFAADKKAHAYFEASPPGYRRTVTHWVVSAKRPETRARRVGILIEHCHKGERIPLLGLDSTKKKNG